MLPKGQRYATILCDLEARRVLDVVVGRTQAEVCPLLERLDQPDRVEAVSMDMSGSFREAVQLCLPRARIVADHFHVVQHVGKALVQVVGRCAHSQEGRNALKGQRHLFLRAHEDLEAEEDEIRARLADRFPDLDAAWRHTEALRRWYATATGADAAAGLDDWIAQVERAGPAELLQALSAFRTWREEILASLPFCPPASAMALSRARTIEPKPSCAKPTAIAIRNTCACVSCWRWPDDFPISFPRKDGDPQRLSS